MSSNADKFKGKTKQVVGKATDNKKLQAKGKVQETRGNLKNAGEKLTDKMDDEM
jgi:uncharacterized protein YjbJ (UPF0337 family)